MRHDLARRAAIRSASDRQHRIVSTIRLGVLSKFMSRHTKNRSGYPQGPGPNPLASDTQSGNALNNRVIAIASASPRRPAECWRTTNRPDRRSDSTYAISTGCRTTLAGTTCRANRWFPGNPWLSNRVATPGLRCRRCVVAPRLPGRMAVERVTEWRGIRTWSTHSAHQTVLRQRRRRRRRRRRRQAPFYGGHRERDSCDTRRHMGKAVSLSQ